MKAKRWKKVLFICGVIFLLVFTFWYGGDAPGLQGFSSEDKKDESLLAQTEESPETDAKENQEKTTEQGTTEKDSNIFQEIVMHITLKSSSSGTSDEKESNKKKATNKQVKNNKKAQKNAEKATKKEKENAEKQSAIEIGGREEKTTASSEEPQNTNMIRCTIYISCATVLDNTDRLTAAKKQIIPQDGIILKETEIKIEKDSTVFDVLQKITKEKKIHLEYCYTPLYKNYYIEGIYNLYEFECGNGSGWLYSVNDEFPTEGCSAYKVENGDVIKWLYTCDFGKDVGKYYEN